VTPDSRLLTLAAPSRGELLHTIDRLRALSNDDLDAALRRPSSASGADRLAIRGPLDRIREGRARRALPRALGGSCHSPVAALAEVTAGGLRLRAEILSGDGAERIAEDRTIADEAGAEALAAAMLERACPATRALFDGKRIEA